MKANHPRRPNALQMTWRRLTPLGWLSVLLILAASLKLVLLVADLAPIFLE